MNKSAFIVDTIVIAIGCCMHLQAAPIGNPVVSLRPADPAIVEAIVNKKVDVFAAIRILDSLRKAGFDREEFLGTYAQYVFNAFMPVKNDSFPGLFKNPDQIPSTDTAFPCAFRWRIVSSPQAQYPFFEYWAGFVFRKQFRLVFTGLRSHTPGRAWLHFRDREPLSPVTGDLINQMNDRVDSAWCTIHIDINDTKISPYEYLLKRIDGVYDSIAVKKDLFKYHAISLRCLRRGLFLKPEGMSTAYIVFDRNTMDIFRTDSMRRKPRAWKTDKTVRFTLTMRCGCDIQDQAEQKLLSILRAF
jgi:hypothetical protein